MPAGPLAPEPVGRGGWIGVDRPLALARLRGKVVVLHFLRFSSAACLRVVEELRPLQRLFAEELVVVGIHSPGFAHEAEHPAVVSGVVRHRVEHPVLDDPELATARAYGVSGWPTLVVIDPEGRVAKDFFGDGVKGQLERLVADLVAEADAAGTLRPGPLEPTGPRATLPVPLATLPVPLAYPAKVAVSPDGRRLAVADTSFDQVVVCTLDGLVLDVHTGFSHPRGVRFDDSGSVVVCDTAAGRVVRSSGEVVADAMSSPWDLVADRDGSWIVAEAGRNRLLRLKPGEFRGRVAAGTGSEGTADGTAAKSELAQPSGVARTTGGIAFVDAETGSLRLLGDDQRVTTLVGGGLEHPLGVAADATGHVYVADTYDSTIKVWDGASLRALPVEGLDEPGGLDVLPDGRLVVADTNHHRVVVVDPASGRVDAVVLDEGWVHAQEEDPVVTSSGASFAVPWRIELVGEELEGARRTPVRVAVHSRPGSLLATAGGPVVWTGADRRGVLTLRADQRGSGMLLVEVVADVRQGQRRRLRRIQRWRRHLEVR